MLPIGLCGLGLEAENGSHRARRRVACRIAARPAAAVSSFAASFSAAAVVSRSYRRAAAAASISTTSETRREPAVASLTAVARALATAAAVAASRAPMSFCVSFSAARIRLCSRLTYSACSSFMALHLLRRVRENCRMFAARNQHSCMRRSLRFVVLHRRAGSILDGAGREIDDGVSQLAGLLPQTLQLRARLVMLSLPLPLVNRRAHHWPLAVHPSLHLPPVLDSEYCIGDVLVRYVTDQRRVRAGDGVGTRGLSFFRGGGHLAGLVPLGCLLLPQGSPYVEQVHVRLPLVAAHTAVCFGLDCVHRAVSVSPAATSWI